MLRSINPAAAAIALLLFIVPQANLSFANEACEIDLSDVNPVSHDTALEELKAIGFVSLSESGTRYSIESAQSSAATEILRWIASLDPAAKNAAPLKFYLQVAGSTLDLPHDAHCFIKNGIAKETQESTGFLKLLSNFIKKNPENEVLLASFSAVADLLSNDQTLDFLTTVQAVYFPTSGTGIGVNPSNVRFDKTKMAHMPNEIMRRLAGNIDESSPAVRQIVYQVKHMGY